MKSLVRILGSGSFDREEHNWNINKKLGWNIGESSVCLAALFDFLPIKIRRISDIIRKSFYKLFT